MICSSSYFDIIAIFNINRTLSKRMDGAGKTANEFPFQPTIESER